MTVLFAAAGLVPAFPASAPAAPAAPAAATPQAPQAIRPFLCPEGGPNSGRPPQAMAKSAGHTLVLCADPEGESGRGIVASGAAIHEPASKTPGKAIYSLVDDTGHLRIESIPDRGFSVTFESLLPRGTEYQWTPVYASEVACGEDGCRERDSRCALDLPSSERRDLLGRVRQLSRQGPLEPSVGQRLIDDLVLQALLGDDVAAWTVEHLDTILPVATENREALLKSRQLLEKARDSKCDALVSPPDVPPPPPDPAASAALLKERIARTKAGERPEPPPPPGGLDGVAWLVGGRWDGRGTLPGGGTLHVEETYRWGPARRSIRFVARNAGTTGKSAQAVDGIIYHEAKAGKVILWNVKPGGGLSESAVTRADRNGCEFVGADGRVRLTRGDGDHQTRVVDQLHAGTWTTVVSATYERQR
jgi:hypothetical protein